MQLNFKSVILNKYIKEFLDSPRDSPWGKTQRDQKAGLEFSANDYNEIDKYCKTKNIEWFASAWDVNSQKFLQQFNCKFNKVASAMLVHKELLKIISKEKNILSFQLECPLIRILKLQLIFLITRIVHLN